MGFLRRWRDSSLEDTVFANNRCLAGKMIWAVDLDEPGSPTLKALASGSSGDGGIGGLPREIFGDLSLNAALRVDRDLRAQNEAPATLILTDCGEECPVGWHAITKASGVWAGAGKDVEECKLNRGPNAIHNRDVGRGKRALCAPNKMEVGGCSWVGQPLFCSPPRVSTILNPGFGGCPKGSIHLANNNMPPSSDDNDNPKECFPGTYSAFCCNSVEVKLERRWCDEFDYGSLAMAGGVAGALGFNGCHFFRGGDIEDLIRLGYTPYNLPPGSTFEWPEDLDEDEDEECTMTITTSTTSWSTTITTRTCNVQSWPQACHNYVSVAKHWMRHGHNPALHSDHLLCPWVRETRGRSAPLTWNDQHEPWRTWLP
ncbi:hypothetical protein SODALDRAFT_166751 [Sodiomyces alkalinus F11]|uniref:Uncharacterized protein n=1 Tax=Sodiomyces alkalinus (strain CBS 110278 / VKM F-3762 / F11) TaxID=1314773 RepID=A0A3N2PVU6_SODAK|nr:hypothetical protein SODALDRAFT_166751 [Sodiomyces alkalinus F11]ROT38621.1 hypothetical protein SODALDRAFT_166751 [Sodiomyces alkalinus F11]